MRRVYPRMIIQKNGSMEYLPSLTLMLKVMFERSPRPGRCAQSLLRSIENRSALGQPLLPRDVARCHDRVRHLDTKAFGTALNADISLMMAFLSHLPKNGSIPPILTRTRPKLGGQATEFLENDLRASVGIWLLAYDQRVPSPRGA